MLDNPKGIQVVEDILEAAKIRAAEYISKKHTGTIIIEIGFLDGGVRRNPTVREMRVLEMRAPKD